jgi:hypothetical protein
MKKAQMFVITMVFLVGLVFVIQQGFINWFSYSMGFFADIQKNDYYLLDNVKTMAEQTMENSQSCTEARESLNELKSFLQSRVFSGYFLEFMYRLNCANWNNNPPSPAPLNVTIHITGENIDTSGNFFLYRFP